MEDVETASPPLPKTPPAQPQGADLDRSLVHGIAWTSAVTWISQILNWASTIVVVHYLVPSDYGVMSMAMLYMGFAQMVSDLGVGAAVLRFRDLTDDQVGQFNSMSLLSGVACVSIALAAAVPMGHFFHEPRLPLLIAVMSSTFVITAFRIVPQALLERTLQFRTLAKIDGTQSFIRAAATLAMAIAGFGYWTLAIGPIIGASLYAVMVVWQAPTGFRRPQWESIRKPFTFSSHMLVSRVAWYAFSNADFAVIGRVLGAEASGAYVLGWTLSGMAVEKITALIGRVTPAFFSAVQTDMAALRRYLLVITEGLALLTFPACIGLALVSEELVRLALGAQWGVAIVPLRLLAILATFRSIQPLIPQVLAAIGESRLNMYNTVLTALVLPFAFYIATRWGIAGVAVAWLILYPVMASPLLGQTFRRIGLPTRSYVAALWPATSACVVMAITVLSVQRSFLVGVPLYVSLVAKIVVGAGAYAATLFVLHRQRILVIKELVGMLRGRKESAVTPTIEAAAV